MNAGQIIAQTLKLYEVEYFFAFSGGDIEIWQGLHNAGIRYVLPRSERSGVAMADAYSRITGKPSFTYGQAGPGAVICVSGMADAYWGQSAVVCITSDVNSKNLYRYAYQGIDDQQSLFAPIVKWNTRVPNIFRLPDILRTAIRIAVSGVPGPVHIDIPFELTLLSKEDFADAQLYAEPECKRFPAYRVAPVPQDIDKILSMIAQAQRPLILAGGGVISSEAWDELTDFAETLTIPVVTSAAAKSAIATSNPLAVGVCGRYSRKVANEVLRRCDTCIVIGSNLGDMTTKNYQLPTNASKIVHIDLNPNVLGTNFKEELSVMADAKLALKAMSEAAKMCGLSKRVCPWEDWVREVQNMVTSWKIAFQELAKNGGPTESLNPYFVISKLNKMISPQDIIVADTGYMGAFASALVEVMKPGRKYIRTCGSLGWGFPASLGAQLAVKDKGRVICIIGDGGIGYHIADIETAVRWNLPVLVMVMNNSTLAFTYHLQKFLYKDVIPEVNDFLNIDYAAVARAFGAYGEKVKRAEDVEGALKRALDSGKTALVDFAIDREICPPVTSYESLAERQV